MRPRRVMRSAYLNSVSGTQRKRIFRQNGLNKADRSMIIITEAGPAEALTVHRFETLPAAHAAGFTWAGHKTGGRAKRK